MELSFAICCIYINPTSICKSSKLKREFNHGNMCTVFPVIVVMVALTLILRFSLCFIYSRKECPTSLSKIEIIIITALFNCPFLANCIHAKNLSSSTAPKVLPRPFYFVVLFITPPNRNTAQRQQFNQRLQRSANFTSINTQTPVFLW